MLLSSILVITSFAASETITWGAQPTFTYNAIYAKLYGTSDDYSEVYHNFDSVGYTYKNATCGKEDSQIRFHIEKRGFLGIWGEKSTSIGPVENPTIEYGYGGSYGEGTYRFKLTPINNSVGTTFYAIKVNEFFSKASSNN